VAEPAPSLALTTSSPPNWMRFTSASRFSLLPRISAGWRQPNHAHTLTICGWLCVSKGRIVAPEWPPTTGILYLGASCALPTTVATKVLARTMSR
jgi:hypothetical protein